ncbi:MAG: hypothetical protein QXT43_02220 [Candidatus Micrarchaeaceae archaeon]
MEIEKQIMAYCPYCNKHTLHNVKQVSSGKVRANSFRNRKHDRTASGYVGSVEPRLVVKKQGKRQRVVLQCTTCKKSVVRVFFGRTKKKIEIKR